MDILLFIIEWGMVLLLNYFVVMVKVKVEIDEVIGMVCILEEVDLLNFFYFGCIIKEILCFYFVGLFLVLYELVFDCLVGGYDIFVGMMFFVNVYVMYSDVCVWEELESFFLESFEGGNSDGKWMFLFGMGWWWCFGEGFVVKMVGFVLGMFL